MSYPAWFASFRNPLVSSVVAHDAMERAPSISDSIASSKKRKGCSVLTSISKSMGSPAPDNWATKPTRSSTSKEDDFAHRRNSSMEFQSEDEAGTRGCPPLFHNEADTRRISPALSNRAWSMLPTSNSKFRRDCLYSSLATGGMAESNTGSPATELLTSKAFEQICEKFTRAFLNQVHWTMKPGSLKPNRKDCADGNGWYVDLERNIHIRSLAVNNAPIISLLEESRPHASWTITFSQFATYLSNARKRG
mmetsp:Transcript_10323/g.29031  ORF Transcript_10323/g.29031 Transcript_10323/m.29031 type:complete len:250 (+) Transcript_10323:7075-7824(+)